MGPYRLRPKSLRGTTFGVKEGTVAATNQSTGVSIAQPAISETVASEFSRRLGAPCQCPLSKVLLNMI